MGTNNFK